MAKNNLSLFGIFKNLIQAYMQRLSDFTYLASLEARLAIKTLITISVLFLVMLLLVASFWFSLLLIFYFYLISWNYSSLFSTGMIALLNFVLIILVYFIVRKIKKNLFFPATRRQISNIKK